MIIKNVRIYMPDGTFKKGGVRIADDRIDGVFIGDEMPDISSDDEVIDGDGNMLLPGFIDLHFHGANGDDLSDGTKEAITNLAAYEASCGITGICPATMTVPVPELMASLEAAAAFKAEQEDGGHGEGASLLGISMEGPFISKARRGAQDARNILPRSISVFREFQSISGKMVKILTIAPEEEGIASTPEFIAELKSGDDTDVHVAIGHSSADYNTAKEAFDAGADHVIHLFNAMPGLGHRNPGIIGAAAENPAVTAELICDGIHVHPSVVRAAFALFGSERIILISDSMRGTGLCDGTYTLGGLQVNVEGRMATMIDGGAIAGSVTHLADCVREAVCMGVPLSDAVRCATANPAKKLGVYDICGSIEAGKRADLVIWDDELKLKKVIMRGRLL